MRPDPAGLPARLLIAAVVATGFLSIDISAAVPPDARPEFPAIRLSKKLQGSKALDSISNQLPDIAAFYRKTPAELEKQLRQDKSLWVDERGRLFFVCDWAATATNNVLSDINAVTPGAQIAPLDQTFLLHSRPGATKTIFLDFDGYTISGTAWNGNNGGADIVAPPWDTDGNSASFGTNEMTAIQQIWLRVAEDYAPFDVDVTTQDPGDAALTRSSSSDQIYGTRALVSAIGSYFGNPGGIAYVGVYDNVGDYYKPALIFPENLGNNEKNIAEAISHEVGHNLGLSHDGVDFYGTHTEYYGGQAYWAPIMGVGYGRPITQWSKGEYAFPSNTEDDLTVIQQNGLSFRTDLFGNSIANATPLSGTTISTNGIIEQNTDKDFFSFQGGGGTAQITVSPSERGQNLHLVVSIYNSSGVLLTNGEAVDSWNGISPVTFSIPVEASTYYLSVAGGSSGNPLASGYSAYASLGQYTVSITLPPISPWIPTAPGTYAWAETTNWSIGVPNAPDANARFTNNIIGDQLITLDAAIAVGRLQIGDANSSHSFTIQNGTGGPLTFDTLGNDAYLVKTAGAADEIAANIFLADRLIVTNSSVANLTLSGPISGSAGLVKSGAGLVTLSGTDTYSGDTVISNGRLQLGATGTIGNSANIIANGVFDASAVVGGLIVSSNQTLGGNGAVAGDVSLNSGAKLWPGATGTPSTLTLSNGLTLSGNAALNFSLSPSNSVGSGTNDLIIVTGNLSLSGSNTFSVLPTTGQLLSPGAYTVLQYGSMNGSAANLTYVNQSRYQATVDDSVTGQLKLNLSGGPGTLTWRGDGSGNVWNIAGASNWINGSTSDRFYQFDSVTFDDSGSNNTSINLSTALTPLAVTVNASKNYTFAGTGKLTGVASLTKQGTGTLTLNSANDFTGAFTVSGGTLKPALATALSGTNILNLQSTGTLDVNGLNLGTKPISVSGTGLSGNGAIINSGSSQINALQFVTLTGDATFGGANRWDIRANPTAILSGNGFKLTKTGANDIWLVDLGNTALGNIDVRQGLLGIQGNTTMGNSAATLSLWPGSTLVFWDNTTNVLNKSLQLTNATVRNDSANNAFAGPINLNSSNYFNIVNSLGLRGPISGSGILAKAGTGVLILSGTNTFTGNLYMDTGSTTSSDGIVRLANQNSLSGSGTIYFRNNNNGSSTLQLDGSSGNMVIPRGITMSGRNNASVAVQNISGSNAITGVLTVDVGGANYIFQSDSGTLAFTSTLPLSTPGGTRTLTFQGGADHLLSGTIQNGAGSGTVALTKSGSGKLTITGNGNSYTGTTTINGGTVQLGNGSAGGKFGTGPVINNALLQFNRSDNFTFNNDVSGTNGQFIKLNSNTVTLISTNLCLSTSSGAAQVNGGTLLINSPGKLVANNEFWIGQNASTGAVTVTGGTLISSNWIAIGRNNSAANGSLTLNSGSIQKFGSGNIILGSLGGTGTLTVNGGTISNNSQILLAESTTGKGFLVLNGGLVQASSVAKFGGSTATAKFNGGTLQAIADSTAFISGLNSAQIQAGGFTLDDGGFAITNGQALLEDATSPGGGFAKKGSGMVTLTVANTFRGDTRINAGTLRLGNSSALQFSTLNLTTGDTGALSFGTLTSTTLGGLAGTRDLALTNQSGLAVTLTVGGNGSNTVYSGSLSGNGNLTKNGAGTLVLSGANNYSSSTVVNGGTLVVDGSLGAGSVNINNSTLAGSGAIGGAVTIQASSTLAPGTGIGMLSVNSLSLAGKTVMEISHTGPASDTVNVAGLLSRGGSLIVTNIGGALAAGDSFTLFNAGSTSGSFASITLPSLVPTLRWDTNQFASTGTISVAAIPSPQIAAFLSGTNLSLQFPTENGVSYVLESATNLIAPVLWLPQSTNQGNGAVMLLQIPIDGQQPQNFFRLQLY